MRSPDDRVEMPGFTIGQLPQDSFNSAYKQPVTYLPAATKNRLKLVKTCTNM